MGEALKFDYYYGVEAEQFSFYRVPRLLIKDGRFKDLSSDAKLLYGLMLDRMALSVRNGWLDEENRAYIYYTLDNIMDDLGCAREKCVKVLAELDSKKGIGLIRKKRQGLGKPDIIYVMNFATLPEKREKDSGNADISQEVRKPDFKKFGNRTSGSSETESQEVRKPDFREFGNQTSESSETESQEVRLPNATYKEMNQKGENHTDLSYINPINPSAENADDRKVQEKADRDRIDGMDGTAAYLALIRGNLEYARHMSHDSREDRQLFEEIYETVCDVVCVKRESIRIGKEDYPYELVKSRFLKLNSSHVEYVMGCMRETATKIKNIRAYLITTLYNAPSTMNHYYQQEVQYDMYGGGWEEKGIR